jgi:hypothetical protein
VPKIAYKAINFNDTEVAMIKAANRIIVNMQRQGFKLTVRQLYYQFVAHDLFPEDRKWTQNPATGKWFRDPNGTKNAEPNYKWICNILNDGRMGGLVDWSAIEDRTRNLETLPHWDGPNDIVTAVSQQFRYERWADQPNRVEVWIEKDALVGLIEGVCREMDVPYFSCRGYTSLSEMWDAGQRLKEYADGGQHPVILHFGDHDPSGKDMTRDIQERLELFSGGEIEVRRLALTWDQIEQYNPPPNWAKITDPRAKAYIREFGDESWELDSMDPATMAGLIRGELEDLIDQDLWREADDNQAEAREQLQQIADRYDDVTNFLKGDDDGE